jgi:acyl dehydratase
VPTPELQSAEDLRVGASYDLGDFVLTNDAILSFSREWDPQTFHLDDESSRSHYFGGVVASGAQLVAVFQRLAVLAVYQHWHVYAGRSLTDVRFLRPVRGGARLRGEMVIAGVKMTHPERALVMHSARLFDGDGQVLEMTMELYVYRRRVAPAVLTPVD